MKKILVFTFLIILFGVAAAQCQEKEKLCPFGVCMGADPATLYSGEYSEQERFDYHMQNDYSASRMDNFEALDFLKDFITGDRDEYYFYTAYYSKKTGVCAVRVDTAFLNENKKKIIDKLKDYVEGEVGFLPEEIFKGSDKLLLWSGDKLEATDLNLAVLRYNIKPTSHTILMTNNRIFYVLLEFRFNNYDDCIKEEPDIP